jgi:hypothetical protein
MEDCLQGQGLGHRGEGLVVGRQLQGRLTPPFARLRVLRWCLPRQRPPGVDKQPVC